MILNWQADDYVVTGYAATSADSTAGSGHFLVLTGVLSSLAASTVRVAGKVASGTTIAAITARTAQLVKVIAPALQFLPSFLATRPTINKLLDSASHAPSASTARMAGPAITGFQNVASGLTVKIATRLQSGALHFTGSFLAEHPLISLFLTGSFQMAATNVRAITHTVPAATASRVATVSRAMVQNVGALFTLAAFLGRAMFGGTHEPGSLTVTVASCVITINVHADH
jgi:hypothetical protein